MNKTFKRLLSIILCVSLIFSFGTAFAEETPPMYEPTEEERIEEEMKKYEEFMQKEMEAERLQDRYNQLEQTLKSVEQKLKDAQNKKNSAVNKRSAVKAEINTIQAQIDNLNEQMDILNSQIEMQEIEIVNKEMEIEESQAKFEYRLVANQSAGTIDIFKLLFSSASFSDFLTSLETIRQFADYDTTLVKKLNADKKALEDARTQLEESKASLNDVMCQAEEKRAELDAKYKELNGEVYSLQALADAYAKDKETIEQGMEDAQAELEAIYAGLISSGEYVGGEFTWPVPSTHYISSEYGNRTFKINGGWYSDFHTGIDFSGGGCYGKEIVAANAGTVTYVKTTYVQGKGYGKYLIIDHGGGKSTLYAHCSSIAVKEGQHVAKGQTVAYIGSTGFSTGAHLHFEIRINGKHVDPLPYMPGK